MTTPCAPLAGGAFLKATREGTGHPDEWDPVTGNLIRPMIVGRLKYPGDVTEDIGWPVGPNLAGEYFTITQVDVHHDGTSSVWLRHAVPSDFDRYAPELRELLLTRSAGDPVLEHLHAVRDAFRSGS